MNRAVVFDSPWCRLLEQTLAGGEPYYMLDCADYVAVIARTQRGTFVLVQQHRPVVGHDSIEFPSGHVDPGETAEDAGRRELREETGMVAAGMELLGVLSPDIGRLANRMWCYFADGVVPAESHVPEAGIAVLEVDQPTLVAMAGDGRMEHALNLAALFLAVSRGRLRV
jgi:ADP-ribose pyrophosphatase